MTWILVGLAGFVGHLFVRLWVLSRTQHREALILRAHITLLWRRVEKTEGDAVVPVREVYAELTRLAMSAADANYYSGYYDAVTAEDDDT